MHTRQQVLGIIWPPLLWTLIVDVTVQMAVAFPPVGLYRTVRLNGLCDEPVQCGLTGVGNLTQADATDTRTIGLGSHHNHRLFYGFPASDTLFLATPECLIDLHQPVQSFTPRPYHRPPQFMQHRPRRLVTAESHHPL